MKDAIEVSGLKKSYGSNMVLRGLDFQIKQGEIFALLGVNGAGKTTTLECIEGMRKYDGGNVIVNGQNGNSTAVIFFASSYQTYGGDKALCKMESYIH